MEKSSYNSDMQSEGNVTVLNQIYLVRQKNYANNCYIVFMLPWKLNTRSPITESQENEAKMHRILKSTSKAYNVTHTLSKMDWVKRFMIPCFN